MPLLLTLLATAGAIALLELAIRRGRATSGMIATLLTTAIVLGSLGTAMLLRGAAVIAIPAIGTAIAAYVRYRQLRRLAEQPPRRPGAITADPAMNRAQALAVLGLDAQASRDDIVAAHRRLIAGLHPDQGGSSYLASQINEARDILLG